MFSYERDGNMQHRIVVKIGSSSLTSPEGGLNREKIEYYARELSSLQAQGIQVLLVTSGAVAAGFRTIGYKQRPKLLAEKQAAAAVGQALLMQAYNSAFSANSIGVAQILLTRMDFSHRRRINNAMMTLEELFRHGIIPIINENDTVSVDELKFGDNDMLSALVANLVKAEKLIIVTDMDGLYTGDPRKDTSAYRIERVALIDEKIMNYAGGAGSAVGTGGMRSKIDAARIAVRGGIPVFIGKVSEPGDLSLATDNRGRGTYFDTSLNTLTVKKQWIGFHSEPRGQVIVDEGAVKALIHGGKSLLPAGVTAVSGDFFPGDVIEVVRQDRQVIGRGVVNYTSAQLIAVSGMNTEEVTRRIDVQRIEVIHRDEWLSLL
jgi:glutamate 5-kinase